MIENSPGSARALVIGPSDGPGTDADGGTDADCAASASDGDAEGEEPVPGTEGEGVRVAVRQPTATRATSAIATTCLKRAAGPGPRRAW